MDQTSRIIAALRHALEAAEVLEMLFKQAESMHVGAIPETNIDCQITTSDLRKGLYAAPEIRRALECLSSAELADSLPVLKSDLAKAQVELNMARHDLRTIHNRSVQAKQEGEVLCPDWLLKITNKALSQELTKPVAPAPAGLSKDEMEHMFWLIAEGLETSVDMRHWSLVANAVVDAMAKKQMSHTGELSSQGTIDAQRYRWLFDARTEDQCADENVGLMAPKQQDLVLAKIATTYMHKEAVDALVDEAMEKDCAHQGDALTSS